MNTNFDIKDNVVIMKINKEIYSKEVVIQAAYVLLDEFYFFIDLDEKYFIVSMEFKEKTEEISLKDAVYRFFDELIESQSYLDQIKRVSKTRELMLERALLGQTLDDETIESLKFDEERQD